MSTLLFSMQLNAQHGFKQNSNIRDGENRYVHNWTIEAFLGGTFKKHIELYTIGIDYEHRLHLFDDHIAIGVLMDYEFSSLEEEILLTPMLFYFLGHHWKVMAGTGVSCFNEKENGVNYFEESICMTLFRIGLAKEFDFNEHLIVSPNIQLDLTKRYSALVVGLGFGWGR
jgi:hypothetical protein